MVNIDKKTGFINREILLNLSYNEAKKRLMSIAREVASTFTIAFSINLMGYLPFYNLLSKILLLLSISLSF